MALTSAINAKFSNKVVQDIGLCICLYDILQSSDGIVQAGDGCAYVTIVFRLVVFRPFIGEILTGKITNCTDEGIKVSLGFFDDIFVPKHLLLEDTTFDRTETIWTWRPEGAELYLQIDDSIRFRVEEEHFVDCTPGKKGVIDRSITPYSLVCSADSSGLGNVQWWEE